MSAKKPNIQQIRKYLNGELDARAMFELERRAEADPFLWDMIKGMEAGNANDQVILDEIDKLIDKRVEKDKKRVIPLWTITSVAASLLIALSIGGWLFMHQSEKPMVAFNTVKKSTPPEKEKAKAESITVNPVLPFTKQPVIAQLKRGKSYSPISIKTDTAEYAANTYKVRDDATVEQLLKKMPGLAVDEKGNITAQERNVAKAKIMDSNALSSNRLAEVKIRGYSSPLKKTEVFGAASSTIQAKDLEQLQPTSITQALQGRVAGVDVSTKLKAVSISRTITGVVIDKNDKTPLVGVSILVKDKSIGAVTGIDGKFAITVPATVETLNVAYIGYVSQQVKINKDNKLDIALAPTGQSLSEVVVIGYGTPKEHVNEGAHPSVGWDNYDKYIKENAIMPNGQTGVVRLAFTVDAKGTISNILIKKGETPEMNQKAIDILKNGPTWVGDNDGKPKVKRLRIKFHK